MIRWVAVQVREWRFWEESRVSCDGTAQKSCGPVCSPVRGTGRGGEDPGKSQKERCLPGSLGRSWGTSPWYEEAASQLAMGAQEGSLASTVQLAEQKRPGELAC